MKTEYLKSTEMISNHRRYVYPEIGSYEKNFEGIKFLACVYMHAVIQNVFSVTWANADYTRNTAPIRLQWR